MIGKVILNFRRRVRRKIQFGGFGVDERMILKCMSKKYICPSNLN
jgi:hypothetical protein